jgi:hypothetical protein
MVKTRSQRAWHVIVTQIIVLSFLFSNSQPTQAAGATFLLSPSKGSYNVGATFSVGVYVNSGGLSINAAEATMSFDKDALKVNTISQSGSIFELWTAKPSYSNTKGTITFGGGATSPYKGSSGKVFSISFTALKQGQAQVSFSGGMITEYGPEGKNVYGGASTGSYTIAEKKPEVIEKPKEVPSDSTTKTPTKDTTTKPKPVDDSQTQATANATKGLLPPAPEITSTSHPNQDDWYPVDKVALDWKILPSIVGASLLLTESPSSTLGNTSDGVIQTKTYDKLADGKHYFHIKLQNGVGWGPTAHRSVLVDKTSPSTPRLEIDNGGDATNPSVLLKMASTDVTSGLSKYKLGFNNSDKDLEPRDYIAAPYQFEKLLPGRYSASVNAYDKAGNMASSSITFVVDPLKAPMITDMPKEIKAKDELIIRGASFYPNSTISIFVGSKNGDPAKYDIKTDENGDWNYFHSGKMAMGNYEIWAKVTDERGAESLGSTRQPLNVIAVDYVTAYGLYLIILLAFIIILLVLYIIILKKNFKGEKAKILEETLEAQKKVNDIFLALQEEVDELIIYADKKAGLSESERRIKEKIKEALDISEEFLNKEIEDIEKEIIVSKKKK